MADFPYRYNFMPSFKEMFDRLKKIDLNNVSKITAGNALGLIERSFPDDYENTDSLADHFVESERILANERGQKSPLETWLAMPKSTENIRLLREKVYQKSRGCNLFNPVLARYLFTRFGGERILDCCAGWGDRLIAALACPKIKEYRAWDPNAELQKCYNAMAEATAHKTLQWSIIPQPFEEAVLEKRYFDLSFASPPFYDKEVYRGSKTSTEKYRTKNEWIDNFFVVLIRKMISATRKGGRIALYLSKGLLLDIARKELRYFKPMGSIGFRQVTNEGIPLGDIRMVYMWQL